MLSLQLGAGVFAQQIWGWIADRLGGLRTILFASAGMAASMMAFLLTQDEIGLYSVSSVFGLAFGGLITRLHPGDPRDLPGCRGFVADPRGDVCWCSRQ
jgi:nitrate/nitrite transporter NarK